MSQSPPGPLDPKIAELLRTTEFEAAPAGAKQRVRNQLGLAGVVSFARDAGAGPSATPPASELGHRAPPVAGRGVAGARLAWTTHAAGKAAITAMAACAIGAVGALLLARPASPGAPTVPRDDNEATPNGHGDAITGDRTRIPMAELDQDRAAIGALPAASAVVAPRAAQPSTKRPTTTDSLGVEQRLLARARAALGRGELESAAQELERHAHLFPNGSLSEERDALRIVTLAQQGNLSVARDRAARFRRMYPRSIQMSTVEGATAERP